MSARKPIREHYDAVLDFTPLRAVPEAAYALIKQTFTIRDGRCVPDLAVPLQHDLRDPDLSPAMPPGSDFWIHKVETDVVVRGSAYAPQGRPIAEMIASVSVGSRAKRIHVLGHRTLQWQDSGRPSFPRPEPFLDMPLTYDNAYGGIDPRMEMEPPASLEALLDFDLCDYPGIYPRNVHGKGYLIQAHPIPGVPLPNLEHPEDRLTPERLCTGDPALWYRQPLPWCFDWTNPLMFPRMAYLGLAPRFPVPSDVELPEVRQGYIAREALTPRPPDEDEQDDIPLGFYQEASLGMRHHELPAGTLIALTGMHPERPELQFMVPPPPELQLHMDGAKVEAHVQLSHCVIVPHALQVQLTYVALVVDMPRVLIPGVHKKIDYRLTVDGDSPIIYEAPTPVLEQITEESRHAG